MCVRVNTLVLCCLLYVVCVCVFVCDTCDLSIAYKIIKMISGQTSSLTVDMEESNRSINIRAVSVLCSLCMLFGFNLLSRLNNPCVCVCVRLCNLKLVCVHVCLIIVC